MGIEEDGWLLLVVHGGAVTDAEAAVGHLEDRVAALGGRLGSEEHDGRAVVSVEMPTSAPDADLVPDPSQ